MSDKGLNVSWIAAATLFAYFVIATMGVISVCWPVCVEILPPPIRPFIGPYLGVLEGVIAFIAIKSYADLLEIFSLDGTFLLYAVLSILTTTYIVVFVPETKHKA